jgi:hypothetical protein
MPALSRSHFFGRLALFVLIDCIIAAGAQNEHMSAIG